MFNEKSLSNCGYERPEDRIAKIAEDKAHDWLLALFKDYGFETKSFQSIRVPKVQGTGKYEIDCVFLVEGYLLAVKVKHWGGSVEACSSGQWKQVTSKQVARLHDNPLEKLKTKAASLKAYLESQRSYRGEKIISIVFFTNESLIVHPKLEGNPLVLSYKNADSRLRCLIIPNAERKRHSFTSLWRKNRASKDASNKPASIQAIAMLPTWDEVKLLGGSVIRGDISQCQLVLNDDERVRRSSSQVLRFKHYNHWIFRLLGWAKSYLSWSGQNGKESKGRLKDKQKIVFLPAGRADAEEISLSEIVEIKFGWQNQDFRKPPISAYPVGGLSKAKSLAPTILACLFS